MSDLKKQITEARKEAMRSGDKERRNTVSLILADIKRVEVDERIELDDTQVLAVLDKMSKQRKDSIAQYEEAGRTDLADTERQELEVIKTFLPQPLTNEEIATLISDAISQSGAAGMQDMGKVMAVLKPNLQGRADMGAVSGLVKAQLAK
jgi:uncharacterized protein YqeY